MPQAPSRSFLANGASPARVGHGRRAWPASPRATLPGCGHAGAGTPHTPGPPSPRRRTLCCCSGEFIRSCRRTARSSVESRRHFRARTAPTRGTWRIRLLHPPPNRNGRPHARISVLSYFRTLVLPALTHYRTHALVFRLRPEDRRRARPAPGTRYPPRWSCCWRATPSRSSPATARRPRASWTRCSCATSATATSTWPSWTSAAPPSSSPSTSRASSRRS